MNDGASFRLSNLPGSFIVGFNDRPSPQYARHILRLDRKGPRPIIFRGSTAPACFVNVPSPHPLIILYVFS